ncbi:MAG: hypothetical protein G4V63_06030 [Candidatus Afipia apatlaquensis]|uniref:Uncharacterized protein n=1 Tax=Candidatus Afipia apatlaquensis TaxID=2712852 RepID=A0A7C9VKV6_9BRAD|nr:hypothetical protein [Candidatus Afipia apatlaquensis]
MLSQTWRRFLTIVNDKKARGINPPLHFWRYEEAMMIKNVMGRLDGPRADNVRLVTTRPDCGILRQRYRRPLLLTATTRPQPKRPGALIRRAP